MSGRGQKDWHAGNKKGKKRQRGHSRDARTGQFHQRPANLHEHVEGQHLLLDNLRRDQEEQRRIQDGIERSHNDSGVYGLARMPSAGTRDHVAVGTDDNAAGDTDDHEWPNITHHSASPCSNEEEDECSVKPAALSAGEIANRSGMSYAHDDRCEISEEPASSKEQDITKMTAEEIAHEIEHEIKHHLYGNARPLRITGYGWANYTPTTDTPTTDPNRGWTTYRGPRHDELDSSIRPLRITGYGWANYTPTTDPNRGWTTYRGPRHDELDSSIFLQLCRDEDSIQLVKKLLDDQPLIIQSKLDVRGLAVAIEAKNYKLAEMLVTRDPSLLRKDNLGYLPIYTLCRNTLCRSDSTDAPLPLLRMWMSQYPESIGIDRWDETPLHMAYHNEEFPSGIFAEMACLCPQAVAKLWYDLLNDSAIGRMASIALPLLRLSPTVHRTEFFYGETLLSHAAEGGDLPYLRFILEAYPWTCVLRRDAEHPKHPGKAPIQIAEDDEGDDWDDWDDGDDYNCSKDRVKIKKCAIFKRFIFELLCVLVEAYLNDLIVLPQELTCEICTFVLPIVATIPQANQTNICNLVQQVVKQLNGQETLEKLITRSTLDGVLSLGEPLEYLFHGMIQMPRYENHVRDNDMITTLSTVCDNLSCIFLVLREGGICKLLLLSSWE